LLVQRTAAGEKKKLEGTIARLESRIAALEDVINNPEGDDMAAEVAGAIVSRSPPRSNAAAVAGDDAAVVALSPARDVSPSSSSENFRSGSSPQIEEQGPADAELNAQLK
jgi:hypothetical protein